jgi:hypothetical protein
VGLEVVSRTMYRIFADADAIAGDETIIQTIDLTALGGDARVEIDQADIPFQVRFNNGGTLAGAGRDGRDIRIIDTVTREAHTLRVTAAGFATLDVRD